LTTAIRGHGRHLLHRFHFCRSTPGDAMLADVPQDTSSSSSAVVVIAVVVIVIALVLIGVIAARRRRRG